MTTIIETERLLLRNWRDEDRAEMFEQLNSQPAVMEHMGGLLDREETDAGVDRCIACQKEYGHSFWALERKSDGMFLGFCGIKRVNDETAPDRGTPEIGWRMREEAWGQGYAKEAAIASLNYGFDKLGFAFVSAFTTSANTPSWGLMERLGMTRRADLDFYDPKWGPIVGPEIVYRIEAREWTGKRRQFA